MVDTRRPNSEMLLDAEETERGKIFAAGERMASEERRKGVSSATDRGRRLKVHTAAHNSAATPIAPNPSPALALQVTPMLPKPKELAWDDLPTDAISSTSPTFLTSHHNPFLGAPLKPDPTSRNRLARKSTLTLSLAGASGHRVRLWRSSPIPPLAARVATLTVPTSLASTTEPPGIWEEDNGDPFAPVRERISACQDRITEHAWVLSYGATVLAQKGRASSHNDAISHSDLLEASALRRSRTSLLAHNPKRRRRRCAFGWEGDASGWDMERARATRRIEHFEHLQEHYLGLMADECGRMGGAHVRTYSWG